MVEKAREFPDKRDGAASSDIHTAATILLLKNVNPKVVSEMLGHATIAITLDIYSHVLPNMQSSAVAAMEEAFSYGLGVVGSVVSTRPLWFSRYLQDFYKWSRGDSNP